MRGRAWVLIVGLAATAGAADFPQFRGPAGNGIVPDQAPVEWGPNKNLKWKAPVPGVAWSCPIVVGDKIILTTAVTGNQPKPRTGFGGGGGRGRGERAAELPVYEFRVVGLDRATGKPLWDTTARKAAPLQPTHASNTFASETPASDGERIFAYFGNAGLYCYDLAGMLLWEKDLGAYPMQSGWGTSSSPVVHDGKVFVQCDNEEASFLVALNAKSGEEVWRKSRAEKSAWSTPYVWTAAGRTDLVVTGGQKIRGYNPENGEVVWELAVGGGQSSASPVADDKHLYVGVGVGGGGRRPGGPGVGAAAGTLFAIKPLPTGEITPKAGESTSASVAWSVPKVWPAAASPLAYRGHVYLLDRQGGMVSCFDAATGRAEYAKERLPRAKAFWASPWAKGDLIFCLDEDGQTHVLKAGPTFEVVGINALPREIFWASPAASGEALFLRGTDHLYCIE